MICDVIDNESNDKDAFVVNVKQFMKSCRKVNSEVFGEIIANAISAEYYRNKMSGGGGGEHRGSYPSTHTTLSPEKARHILSDGTVHGHPLTPAQRGFFGAIAGRGRK